MLPDLRLGAEVDEELVTEEWDLWDSGEFKHTFFADGCGGGSGGPVEGEELHEGGPDPCHGPFACKHSQVLVAPTRALMPADTSAMLPYRRLFSTETGVSF